MDKRKPLKVLGLVAVSAFSAAALMSGGHAMAFSLSPEEILRRFARQIVRYVAGDAMETFERTIKDFQDKLRSVYSTDSEDVTKTVAGEAAAVNKATSVEELIYNQNAMSDALDIRTACRLPPGPVIQEAKSKLDIVNADMQDRAPQHSIEQTRRTIFKDRANQALEVARRIQPELPVIADFFITDEGYRTEKDAIAALEFIRSLTEFKRATSIEAITKLDGMTPAVEESLSRDIGRVADVMNATAVLNDIYLSRVRDRGLAQTVINRTTDGESSILKIHANEAGMSLIDVYNYEAEVAAFNPEYVKDIMTAKIEDDQINQSVVPSPVRGYKYLVQMKALEAAFLNRLSEQETQILKLQAILTKQKLRSNMNA